VQKKVVSVGVLGQNVMVNDFAAIEFCYGDCSIALSTRVLWRKNERSSRMLASIFFPRMPHQNDGCRVCFGGRVVAIDDSNVMVLSFLDGIPTGISTKEVLPE